MRLNRGLRAALCATVGATSVLAFAPPAGAVGLDTGYYEVADGQGRADQAPPIVTAGDNPIQLSDLSAASLAGLEVIAVNNDYGTPSAELTAGLADLEAAVRAGAVLVFHDRQVDGAEAYIPGGAGITFVEDSSSSADINVVDDTTLVTNGPGGTVTDATLDGGNSSNHGYVDASTLPAGGRVILSSIVPTEGVTVCYPLDAGAVIYSTIPLDYYLGGNNPAAFREIYAPNVMAFAASGTCGGGVPTNTNRRPIAEPDTAATPPGTAVDIDVLANDRDPDGNFLTPRISAQPTNGTATIDVSRGRVITYTPNAGFEGTDTFTYQAVDRDGGPSEITTVTIVVGGSAACAPDAFPADAFDDVDPASTHAESIDCLAFWDVVNGTTATTFSPAASVRRDQMASFVARVLREAGVGTTTTPPDAFTDDDGVHEDNINFLAALGVVEGTSATTFSPELFVTRDQVASLVVRAYEEATDEALPAGADAFGDDEGNVHEANINKAAAAGFVTGTDADTYAPRADIRRDQMASIIRRVLDQLVIDGLATPPTAS